MVWLALLGSRTTALFAPPFPSPPRTTPGTQDYNFTNSSSLPPGAYRNITVTSGSTLTLSPGTYNINSLTVSGRSTVTLSPPGQVILNVAGEAVAQAVNLGGGGIINPTARAINFEIVYGGSLPIMLSGGSATYAMVYAPNAPVSLSGGSDWFGSMAVEPPSPSSAW